MRKIGLLAFVLLCCISGAAFAQDAAPTFCGGLSDEDCAIIINSQEAMQSLDSIAFDLNVDVTTSNIPDMSAPITVTLTGNGAVTGMQALSSFSDMTAFEEDPGNSIAELLSSFDLDFSLTLSLPPALMGEMMGPGAPSDITIEVRMVDGVAYLNTEPLQPLLNQPSMQGWYGLDIANMIKAVITQMPGVLDEMSTMMESQGGANSMAYMEEFADPEFLAEFVSITRTDDGSGDVATFDTKVDLGALMSSPQFHDIFMQQMQAQMEMQGQDMSDQEMQMAMAMSEQMMEGMIIKITEDIGISDGYIHSISGSMVFDTAGMMSAMGSAMGGSSSSSSTEEAPVVNITFDLNYSDFDSVAEITAPEDATVIPYEMLLQGMMGSMGGMGSAGAAPVAEITPTPTASS
jgi:hypothetical protein